MKFTVVGNVKIIVKYFETNKYIFFEIIDTGVGIKPEYLELICQPFQSFNECNINPYGNGIGLYTS